ncbi:MAG: SDR family oxidoreductase, partial [Thermomicrobiales bacterium]
MTQTTSDVPAGLDPPGSLAGQVALVTGSTRGLGRTMVDWLARAGAGIVVSGRDEADVAAIVAEVSAAGVVCRGYAADLARPEAAHRLAERALADGPVDILVNNAGMSLRGPFWDVTDAEFEEQVNVNFRAPFILSQHVARHLIGRGAGGRIVNVSTIGAHGAHPDGAVYDSAKGAIETLTRNMAHELAPHGVTVNCVIPGAIPERPGSELTDADRASVTRYIPVGRVGRAADIAAAVAFFCSPASAFTTGQSLLVDGGHRG